MWSITEQTHGNLESICELETMCYTYIVVTRRALARGSILSE